MKIGFDGRFLGPQPSGNGVFSRMVLTHLARQDPRDRVVVYLTRDLDLARQGNVQWKRMPLLHRSPHLRFLFTFSRELRKNPVDIFHAVYTVPCRVPAKVVLSLIEFFWVTNPEIFPAHPLARLQFSLMTRYSVSRADKIIVPTRYVKEKLLATFSVNEAKVEVVPLGVDSTFGAPISGEQIGQVLARYGVSPPYLLFVGDLHPRKNLQRMIQSYNLIREAGESAAQLVLVGKKLWKVHPIMKSVELSPFREDVRCLGYVPLEDLRALYQGACLFVFPSLEEGFGIPPLEAMASNVPVAASNRSSVREVVAGAGILFDPLDPWDMKRAILEGLENHALRADLLARGRERVRDLSWEACARRIRSVYEAVHAAA